MSSSGRPEERPDRGSRAHHSCEPQRGSGWSSQQGKLSRETGQRECRSALVSIGRALVLAHV